MNLTPARKARLRAATEKACKAMTHGMKKPQLEARLAEVRGKLKASIGYDGKPLRGLAERVKACKAEIARLEAAIASAK
jgi:hypothetical protein